MDDPSAPGTQNDIHCEENSEGGGKLCRDFMRNVCNRGKNCRFVHPPDVKIKTDPIFCHDYQQNKCFRATCKFIHCTREEEEHYKSTGELPEELATGAGGMAGDYYNSTPSARPSMGGGRGGGGKSMGMSGGMRGGRGGGGGGRGGGSWIDNDDPSIPLCKDYLKGVCDRPPGGCKFRHVDSGHGHGRSSGGYGAPVSAGAGTPAARRRMGEASYYGQGPPAAKRTYDGYATVPDTGRLSEYDDFYNPEYSNPPPPPPPATNSAAAYRAAIAAAAAAVATPDPYGVRHTSNGASAAYGHLSSDTSQLLNSYTSATAMKAMEDENFMLKRRIEELKKQVSDLVATNEYLLSQNATLRLTNMNTINLQKDNSQPSSNVNVGLELTPSMTVAASQMSTLPTVSMVITPSMGGTGGSGLTSLPAVSMGLTSSMTAAAVSQMSTLPTMSLAP